MVGLGGVQLRPVLGSYDGGISLRLLMQEGYGFFPHSHLIHTPLDAHKMMTAMGSRNIVIMRGHGVTVTGTTVEDATIRAVVFEALCRISWQLARAGVEAPEVSVETVEEYAAVWGRSGFAPRHTDGFWRHWQELLETEAALPLRVGLDDFMI